MHRLFLLVALAACAAEPPPAPPPDLESLTRMFPGADAETDAMLREMVLRPKPRLLPAPEREAPPSPKKAPPPLPTEAECMERARLADEAAAAMRAARPRGEVWYGLPYLPNAKEPAQTAVTATPRRIPHRRRPASDFAWVEYAWAAVVWWW